MTLQESQYKMFRRSAKDKMIERLDTLEQKAITHKNEYVYKKVGSLKKMLADKHHDVWHRLDRELAGMEIHFEPKNEGLLDKRTLSPSAVARKHGVSLASIMKQLKMGKKVEQEHTSNPKATREIALDHLGEVPNYYTKLKKVEEGKEMPKQLREVIETLIEGVSRGHFQAAVNHILLHPEDEREKLTQAHISILSKMNPNMKPESFTNAVTRGTFFNEKASLPKLTQKHFEAVADKLRNMEDVNLRKELGVHYIGIFRRANPRFDEERFTKAASLHESLREIVK